jgi:predicted dehydrogenase
MGVVGWGMQGPGNTGAFMALKDCQVVAACDIDKKHLQKALDSINGRYQNKDCASYHDYREMIARKDIDAVMLAVPDNWHALTATEAAKNKKDIYGEKPLARTIAEQQAIVKSVQKNKIIWQTGSWQRSQGPFRRAAEIVRNGLIGKLTRVEVGLPAGHFDFAGTGKKMSVTPPPAHLNYDRWIGPSQMEPYIEGRVHMNWRWNYNIGGGQLLDWIGHHCDIAHWGMDMDNGGPLEVEGTGEFPPKDAAWNTCTKYRVTCSYPNDITMVIAGYDASNLDWFAKLPESAKVRLYRSDNHQANFIECVKSRKPTITPVETGHHSAIPGHLGLVAMLTGRKLKWDATQEVIVGDPEASKLLARPYRAPYQFPV